jgi:hypothetical protein
MLQVLVLHWTYASYVEPRTTVRIKAGMKDSPTVSTSTVTAILKLQRRVWSITQPSPTMSIMMGVVIPISFSNEPASACSERPRVVCSARKQLSDAILSIKWGFTIIPENHRTIDLNTCISAYFKAQPRQRWAADMNQSCCHVQKVTGNSNGAL